MSYLNIHLGGKDRGLKFNQLALEEFIRRMPTAADNKFDWLQSNALSGYACVYAGLVGNAVVKGELVDFDFEQVSEWVDEAATEDIQQAYKLFADTQHYKKLMEKFAEQIRSASEPETPKKKVRKK